ncbi:hypothetical protein PR048_021826 [Dryococelus australis]|uniref:Uncharacterized protein n=1 Tax=Dryococelus australis TaxID=614101 RepID=A0ABQ9GZE3_9NEOP|nr:hypothetical protein PR048_021826 [Dryococelus australis]
MEQLSLCVRYVEESTEKIKEDFLQFVPITDVIGKGLADTILKALKNVGCFHARAVQWSTDSHKSVYLLAVYLHCSSHSFNLAVTNACSVQVI